MQLLIIAIVILVLFGRGKISEMMGDFGQGVKSFKKGMEDEDTPSQPTRQIAPPHSGEGAVPPVAPDIRTPDTRTPEAKDEPGRMG